MKNARMLLIVALVAGVGHIAFGDDPSNREKEQQNRDQLHSAVQKICPVSGERLGEHGTPIKVSVGKDKEEIFLCCKACLKQKIDPKHWATMHANIAKAQRICPVMKKPLPPKSKWTIVQGQIVYVCCPPCIKKIAAAPQKFLPQIDELYTASLQPKNSRQ
jgi:hypothetical protein